MADGDRTATAPADPLLDHLAALLGEALDVQHVAIKLFAYGHEDVPLRGSHTRRHEGFNRRHEHRTTHDQTSMSLDGTRLCVPIPGMQSPGLLLVENSSELTRAQVVRAEQLAKLLGGAASRLAPPAARLGLRDEQRILKERRTLEALDRTAWCVAEAAQLLGVPRSYVYRVSRTLRARRRRATPRRA